MWKMEMMKGHKIVLDASVCGQSGLWRFMQECIDGGIKFVITSTALAELEHIQKKHFYSAEDIDARKILAYIAEHGESFEHELISDMYGSPEENIIQYCARHKRTVLWTCRRHMADRARRLQIKTVYMKKEVDPFKTLIFLVRTGNELVIPGPMFEKDLIYLRVISDGTEHNEGPVHLKVGDEIMICVKKDGYYSFVHYQMVSLKEFKHCKTLFHHRIYHETMNADIKKLGKGMYRSFLRDVVAAESRKVQESAMAC